MNIRGTDSTALPAVTDLFVPPAPLRQDGGQEFARALDRAPAPGPPATPTSSSAPAQAPARRDDSRPSAPAKHPANRDDERNCESAAPEATENQPQPAGEKPQSDVEAADSPTDDAPVGAAPDQGDDDSAEPKLRDEQQLAQTLAAAQQLPRQQPEKDPTPIHPAEEPRGEAPKSVTETPPVIAGPAPSLLAVEAGPAVVSQSTLVVNAADVTAAALETPAPVAVAATEPQPQVPSVLESPSIQFVIAGDSQNSAATVSRQNGAQAGTSPTPTHASGASPQAIGGRKQMIAPGAAPSTEPNVAVAPVASTDESTNNDEESGGDPPGTQRQIPGANPDLPAAPANIKVDAPPSLTPTANVPPADAPPAATGPDSPPPPGVTQNQAGTTTQFNPTVNPAAAIIQRLPAHALVRHVAEPQPDGLPVQIDSARFLQRVARAFESARDRGGEIRLRLSPPELGALRVEVTMQEQALVARVEVETPEARAALIDNLPILRERLAEQNLRIERFDVDLSNRESSQRGHDFADQQQPERQGQSQPRQPRLAPVRQPVPQTIASQVTSPTGLQDRRLNVIV